MTKILALSGPGNTGKTTLQKRILAELQARGVQILHFPESARIAADEVGTENMSDFQNRIQDIEGKRSEMIKDAIESGLYDIIICDRTWMEQNAYMMYNIMKGIIDEPVTIQPQSTEYDKIYYFDTPIKETKTEEFSHYNSDELNDLMWRMVKGRFGKSAHLYSNGMLDGDRVVSDIIKMVRGN